MEKIKFPWIEEPKEEPKEEFLVEKPQPSLSGWKRAYALSKPYLPYLIALALLFLASLYRRGDSKPSASLPQHTSRTVPVVISLVAIPKGTPIPPEALDIVEVHASSLSKAQRLRAFTPEQLNKLTQKIVAKRDIPSQVPIFWNDLQLLQSKSQTNTRQKTEILF
jgi:hypothetical protein